MGLRGPAAESRAGFDGIPCPVWLGPRCDWCDGCGLGAGPGVHRCAEGQGPGRGPAGRGRSGTCANAGGRVCGTRAHRAVAANDDCTGGLGVIGRGNCCRLPARAAFRRVGGPAGPGRSAAARPADDPERGRLPGVRWRRRGGAAGLGALPVAGGSRHVRHHLPANPRGPGGRIPGRLQGAHPLGLPGLGSSAAAQRRAHAGHLDTRLPQAAPNRRRARSDYSHRGGLGRRRRTQPRDPARH